MKLELCTRAGKALRICAVSVLVGLEDLHLYPNGRYEPDCREKVGHFMAAGCSQVILQHVDSSSVRYKRHFYCSQLHVESRGSRRS